SLVICHLYLADHLQVGEAMKRPRVLLADDHKAMRDRVTRHLEAEFDVLEAVEDGRTLLDAASRLNPDVCLLDISMPALNGIETAIQLKQRGSKAKVLFLTIHEDVDFLEAALRTGASGYVLKRRMASDLRQAIRDALAGKTFISSSVVLGERVKRNNE
ncbi:MAG TPA: response regulator transcription factor, partial [Pyrinomonadaceae bacterium]|nr:response regulator transcription factor [Pyrinomonadaceae bacterium]